MDEYDRCCRRNKGPLLSSRWTRHQQQQHQSQELSAFLFSGDARRSKLNCVSACCGVLFIIVLLLQLVDDVDGAVVAGRGPGQPGKKNALELSVLIPLVPQNRHQGQQSQHARKVDWDEGIQSRLQPRSSRLEDFPQLWETMLKRRPSGPTMHNMRGPAGEQMTLQTSLTRSQSSHHSPSGTAGSQSQSQSQSQSTTTTASSPSSGTTTTSMATTSSSSSSTTITTTATATSTTTTTPSTVAAAEAGQSSSSDPSQSPPGGLESDLFNAMPQDQKAALANLDAGAVSALLSTAQQQQEEQRQQQQQQQQPPAWNVPQMKSMVDKIVNRELTVGMLDSLIDTAQKTFKEGELEAKMLAVDPSGLRPRAPSPFFPPADPIGPPRLGSYPGSGRLPSPILPAAPPIQRAPPVPPVPPPPPPSPLQPVASAVASLADALLGAPPAPPSAAPSPMMVAAPGLPPASPPQHPAGPGLEGGQLIQNEIERLTALVQDKIEHNNAALMQRHQEETAAAEQPLAPLRAAPPPSPPHPPPQPPAYLQPQEASHAARSAYGGSSQLPKHRQKQSGVRQQISRPQQQEEHLHPSAAQPPLYPGHSRRHHKGLQQYLDQPASDLLASLHQQQQQQQPHQHGPRLVGPLDGLLGPQQLSTNIIGERSAAQQMRMAADEGKSRMRSFRAPIFG